MNIIGIETSCDESAAAVVKLSRMRTAFRILFEIESSARENDFDILIGQMIIEFDLK